MAVITSMSPSPPPLLSISKSKLPHSSIKPNNNLSPSFNSTFCFSTLPLHKRTILFGKIHNRKTQIWRIYAAPEEALPSDTTAQESSQQIVPTGDDGGGTIISVLLFIAFIALSILTIGVIYIGVTDFLEKREREKFEKELGAEKKNKKKAKVKARDGPRGFGQKIKDDDDVDD